MMNWPQWKGLFPDTSHVYSVTRLVSVRLTVAILSAGGRLGCVISKVPAGSELSSTSHTVGG